MVKGFFAVLSAMVIIAPLSIILVGLTWGAHDIPATGEAQMARGLWALFVYAAAIISFVIFLIMALATAPLVLFWPKPRLGTPDMEVDAEGDAENPDNEYA